MTDYPRFQMITCEPCHRHRHYHGAPVVDLFLRLLYWWQRPGREQNDRQRGALRPGRGLARPVQIAWSICGALLLLQAAAPVIAQEPGRVRGAIEGVDSGVYSIRTRDNTVVKLKLAANASIAASIRSSMSDIRPGLYIGIAAIPQADGTLRALEAHIFDESMRGTAEGHRAWDLLPKSTMTNAVVQEIVGAVDGHTVILRYKEGQKEVLIPDGTTIVTYLPGSVDELRRGAAVFVAGATRQPDGTLEAQRVMVGRDVAPPQ